MKLIRNTFKHIVDGAIYIESLFYVRGVAKQPVKQILILRKDGLGDCIIFYATLAKYRAYYDPSWAAITLVFPTYFKGLEPLLMPLIDEIIWFDHKAFGSSFSYRRRFLLDLKRRGYDMAIYPVFSREAIGDFMMQMTGAPVIVGFDGDDAVMSEYQKIKNNSLYSQLVCVPPDMTNELARDLYFAEQVTGTPPVDNTIFSTQNISFPTINVRLLPTTQYDDILRRPEFANIKNGATYAVVFPGAGAPYKIWPEERFASLVRFISEKGIIPVLAGGPRETGLVGRIKAKIGPLKTPLIDLSGQTELSTLAHILAGATFYFGSDTGILHLAVAVGTPTVALVGSGGIGRFFPYGDLNKNRIVCDTTKSYTISDNWKNIELLPKGLPHPSIAAITEADAQKEIEYILEHLNTKK